MHRVLISLKISDSGPPPKINVDFNFGLNPKNVSLGTVFRTCLFSKILISCLFREFLRYHYWRSEKLLG